MSTTTTLLSVHGLEVRYGPALALSGVSFDVPEKGALAVLGANGAGKSTLARTLSGLVPPVAGGSRSPGGTSRPRPRAPSAGPAWSTCPRDAASSPA